MCYVISYGSYDTDVNEILPLENGWQLVEFAGYKSVLQDVLEVSDPHPSFPYGENSWKFSVDWWSQPGGVADYEIYVYISGPRDVPW